MATKIIVGNALEVLGGLEAGSVHCSVSSPPYFSLRKYQGNQQCDWPEVEYSPMSGLPPIKISGCDPDCEHEWGEKVTKHLRGKVGDHSTLKGGKQKRVERAEQGNWCQKCGGWRGALGHEPTIEMYVGHLVAIYREVRRALRDDGCVFVVMGDSFANQGISGLNVATPSTTFHGGKADARTRTAKIIPVGLRQGDLMMVPHRLALALQADGWVIRNDLVWHKVAPMPESIRGWSWQKHRIKAKRSDRATNLYQAGAGTKQGAGVASRAQRESYYEQGKGASKWIDCPGCPKCKPNGGYVLKKGSWRHTRAHEVVLMCTKKMQYWADQEKVREISATLESKTGWGKNYREGNITIYHASDLGVSSTGETKGKVKGAGAMGINPAGRNPRSVLSPKPEPSGLKHFAIFPSSLIKPLIKAACPEKCCPECGTGWSPVVEKGLTAHDGITESSYPDGSTAKRLALLRQAARERGLEYQNTNSILGYRPTCGCHAKEAGLLPNDLEMINTPTGKRVTDDPSMKTGRAGFNRPRGPNEGTRLITRFEQRRYAEQLKNSPHREEMKEEAGSAFAHYIRTDKSGARPPPEHLLESWIERGWVEQVSLPELDPDPPHVPGVVLDPFLGSGTTALVADRLGLDCVGIELSEDYAKMAKERIEGDAPMFADVTIVKGDVM